MRINQRYLLLALRLLKRLSSSHTCDAISVFASKFGIADVLRLDYPVQLKLTKSHISLIRPPLFKSMFGFISVLSAYVLYILFCIS